MREATLGCHSVILVGHRIVNTVIQTKTVEINGGCLPHKSGLTQGTALGFLGSLPGTLGSVRRTHAKIVSAWAYSNDLVEELLWAKAALLFHVKKRKKLIVRD